MSDITETSARLRNYAKRALRKGKQSFFSRIAKLIFHRAAFVTAFILLQLFVLVVPIVWFYRYSYLFFLCYIALAFVAVLKIIGSRYQSGYKIAWVVLVLTLPVFGGLMYLLYGGNRIDRRSKRKMARQEAVVRESMGQCSPDARRALERLGGDALAQSRYLERSSLSPAHIRTQTEYFPLGEAAFAKMKEELEQAQRFIFLEYFIIHPGKMWNEILDILKRKADQGVEVRVIYDDVGCLYTLPTGYDRQLREMGIQCQVFNPYRPVVTLRLNNRDHRKIMVIDGNVAFTGGINLADEYINAIDRFGHWKDSAILIRGDAVWNFTVMFLSAWDSITGEDEDFSRFRPDLTVWELENDGVVQPYDDSPLDDKPVGANVYHNLISKATDYVWITTPYLIIDDDMTSALCVAAQSGVDVRIITPHIPDKKLVFQLTQAHYPILLEHGVRIFEYTPGFIHAKNFVSDDKYATVGTVNMDYRSLYLHFECGVWMAGSSAVGEIKQDFLNTLAVCKEITLSDAREFSRHRRLVKALLRAFAPLL